MTIEEIEKLLIDTLSLNVQIFIRNSDLLSNLHLNEAITNITNAKKHILLRHSEKDGLFIWRSAHDDTISGS